MVLVITRLQVHGAANNPSDEWLVICGTPFGVINKTSFGPPAVKKILRILSKLTFDHQV